jgi:hypothetical protein
LNHYLWLPNPSLVLSFLRFITHLSLALISMVSKSMDLFEEVTRRSTTYACIMKKYNYLDNNNWFCPTLDSPLGFMIVHDS